ncbi:unnamed protein product [Microthlaspi erraticum]|uniref:Reverse transcriptase zinc-binding domain-containing protein n=1 Tax=Microthlaspi erraticum TaxID=1685480 RepID=A0A6D2LLD1_9BRAS|nr:unnamed protein product [Microthlaspi erraticum]
MQVLREFYSASGLRLNLAKSYLFLDGNNIVVTRTLAFRFGFTPGALPVRYLGLPLLPHKMRPADYQPLLDRVRQRISSWLVKLLSFAGRLQLIQSVISGMVNFWAVVFPLPKQCLREVERMCSAFLWSGAPDSARGAKVSWDSICTPKEEGSGSLRVSWVQSVLLRGKVFWDTRLDSPGSWLWKRLLRLQPLARPFLVCNVGSGLTARFWFDDWTGLGPLLDLAGANGPRVIGINRLATVAEAVRNRSWNLPRGRHPITVLLRAALPLIPSLTSDADYYEWRDLNEDSSGPFSSSKTWSALHPSGPTVTWADSVWFAQRIKKHAFIHWVIARDRLPTRDRLISWGLDVPPVCLLCSTVPESRSHLFFNCPFAAQVWTSFFVTSNILPPNDLDSIQLWVGSASSNAKVTIICKLLVQATIYDIWTERNSCLHRAVIKPAAQVTREIQTLMRRKLYALDTTLPINTSSRNTTNSFLSYWFGGFQI